jgi:hypothetical protein
LARRNSQQIIAELKQRAQFIEPSQPGLLAANADK